MSVIGGKMVCTAAGCSDTGGVTVTFVTVKEASVKSRDRVKSYGEVFTPRYMVDQMLDLVSDDLEASPGFVDKTFLEPAAGTGNFLMAILHRKLRAVREQYPQSEWLQTSLFALASIYGIELLEDNHQEAQAAMLAEFVRFHQEHDVDCSPGTDLHGAATFLIDTNVIRGNTLTGLDWRGEEIQFSWWHRLPGESAMVQREPFTFASLRGYGMDFTVYERYQACPIDKVQDEVRAHA